MNEMYDSNRNNVTLSDLFSAIDEEKKKNKELKVPSKKEPVVTFEDFFKEAALGKVGAHPSPDESVPDPIQNELVERTLGLFTDADTKTVDPLTPLTQDFVTQKDLQNHYKTFIARVQHQLSTVGGGGETKLRRLDDVDRSSIADNKFLKYDAALGKFRFAPVVTEDIVTTHLYATTLVESGSYSATEEDHYIGVNYAGVCIITLPSPVTNGEMLIIKDESGNASINPIKVLGNVDNDPGGFTLGIDNGSISLIYRNGWRIV